MTPETVKAIQTALAPIAEKIGQSAAFGWEVVVAQQKIEAIGSFFWTALFFVAAGFFSLLSFIFSKDKYESAPMIWMMIFAIVSTLLAFGNLYDGIAHLLNPNYYALQFFIHLAR